MITYKTFLRIHRHYSEFDIQISLGSIEHITRSGRSLEHAAIPISYINQGTVDAVALACRVANSVVGVHIELVEGRSKALVEEWKRLWPNIPLYIMHSSYRSVTELLINFLGAVTLNRCHIQTCLSTRRALSPAILAISPSV